MITLSPYPLKVGKISTLKVTPPTRPNVPIQISEGLIVFTMYLNVVPCLRVYIYHHNYVVGMKGFVEVTDADCWRLIHGVFPFLVALVSAVNAATLMGQLMPALGAFIQNDWRILLAKYLQAVFFNHPLVVFSVDSIANSTTSVTRHDAFPLLCFSFLSTVIIHNRTQKTTRPPELSIALLP